MDEALRTEAAVVISPHLLLWPASAVAAAAGAEEEEQHVQPDGLTSLICPHKILHPLLLLLSAGGEILVEYLSKREMKQNWEMC